jgi:hypothetical protein
MAPRRNDWQYAASRKVILTSTLTYILTLSQLDRVEAGSNTSTIALGVIEGDEKGTQYLGI